MRKMEITTQTRKLNDNHFDVVVFRSFLPDGIDQPLISFYSSFFLQFQYVQYLINTTLKMA